LFSNGAARHEQPNSRAGGFRASARQDPTSDLWPFPKHPPVQFAVFAFLIFFFSLVFALLLSLLDFSALFFLVVVFSFFDFFPEDFFADSFPVTFLFFEDEVFFFSAEDCADVLLESRDDEAFFAVLPVVAPLPPFARQ
jgi:hypothetical protein